MQERARKIDKTGTLPENFKAIDEDNFYFMFYVFIL